MGAYFCLIGVSKPSAADALAVLTKLENPEGDYVEVFQGSAGHLLLMPGRELHDAEGISQALSHDLHTSCILLNYSDDVVWSYNLFHSGKEVGAYSSRPNYLDKISNDKYHRLKGDATCMASYWPNVTERDIAGYLTDKELLSASQRDERAYPDDKYDVGDAWQMCDFMRKLGIEYPVNAEGELLYEPLKEATIATQEGLARKAAFKAALDKVTASMNAKRGES